MSAHLVTRSHDHLISSDENCPRFKICEWSLLTHSNLLLDEHESQNQPSLLTTHSLTLTDIVHLWPSNGRI